MKLVYSEPIGFIGLGKMGGGIVRNLLKRGVCVHVYDKNKTKRTIFNGLGAVVHDSPLKVAFHTKIIFLCLPYTPEVENVLFDAAGITHKKVNDLTLIDLSTIRSADARSFRAKLRKKNIRYCDCPVSGLPKKARKGTLTLMFAGSKADYKTVLPYLKLMGKYVIYCGRSGTGQMMKTFNNIVYNINIAAISEILSVAKKVGLDPVAFTKLLVTGSGRSFASEHFLPKILKREFEGDYKLKAAHKWRRPPLPT